jgi:hypothetical protein
LEGVFSYHPEKVKPCESTGRAGGLPYLITQGLEYAVPAHMATGAASQGIGNAIYGQDIGQGMVGAAISAGMAKGFGNGLIGQGFVPELLGHAAIGGVSDGIVAEIYGGDFGQGFAQKTMAGAYGYMFNACGDKIAG